MAVVIDGWPRLAEVGGGGTGRRRRRAASTPRPSTPSGRLRRGALHHRRAGDRHARAHQRGPRGIAGTQPATTPPRHLHRHQRGLQLALRRQGGHLHVRAAGAHRTGRAHPGPYLHIGGDEANTLEPAQYRAFMARAQPLVAKHGKQTMAWHQLASGDPAPGAILETLGGVRAGHGRGRGRRAAGHKVVMAPGDHVYLDMKYGRGERLGVTWAGTVDVRQSYKWEPWTPPARTARGRGTRGRGRVVGARPWSVADAEYLFSAQPGSPRPPGPAGTARLGRTSDPPFGARGALEHTGHQPRTQADVMRTGPRQRRGACGPPRQADPEQGWGSGVLWAGARRVRRLRPRAPGGSGPRSGKQALGVRHLAASAGAGQVERGPVGRRPTCVPASSSGARWVGAGSGEPDGLGAAWLTPRVPDGLRGAGSCGPALACAPTSSSGARWVGAEIRRAEHSACAPPRCLLGAGGRGNRVPARRCWASASFALGRPTGPGQHGEVLFGASGLSPEPDGPGVPDTPGAQDATAPAVRAMIATSTAGMANAVVRLVWWAMSRSSVAPRAARCRRCRSPARWPTRRAPPGCCRPR